MWVQDWTDDDAYPIQFEDWDLEQWAWAFLRRNTEYQADYAHFVAVPECWPGTGDKTPKWPGEVMAYSWSMEFRYCDPPALPGETYGEYWRRNAGCVIDEMPLAEGLMRKWSLYAFLPDPSDDDLMKIPADPTDDEETRIALFEDLQFLPEILDLGLVDRENLDFLFPGFREVEGFNLFRAAPDEPEQVSLRFDVRFNIDRQLKEAKAILKRFRDYLDSDQKDDGNGRFRLERWSTPALRKLPDYLRAYDAFMAGVGPRKLAEKICPPKSLDPATLRSADEDARRAIKEGKKLVNGGYKALLKLP